MVYLSEKAYPSINWSIGTWEKISVFEGKMWKDGSQRPGVTLEDTEKNASVRWEVGYI